MVIPSTGGHLRWILQFPNWIRIKVWHVRIFLVWVCWVLLCKANEIESRNMILTPFLNGHWLSRYIRLYFLTLRLFIENGGDFRSGLSIWNVIMSWLINLFIVCFLVWWLSRFLDKWFVIRLRRRVLKECLRYLLP